jgi:5-(carboxyamino)imidazole ribonucleotide mutase
MKKIAVIMGSDSDLNIVGETIRQLKELGVPVTARVISAHRTPETAAQFAKSARENDFGVIIAAAGLAAHLAGAIAANTTLPVIGLPISAGSLQGLDALLSTAQMPPGVPVAAVGINAARNAALLAAQILALSDKALAEKLSALRRDMASGVFEKDARLEERMAEFL